MDKTKWLLIAVAAYLAYRYLDSAGYFEAAAATLPPNGQKLITDGAVPPPVVVDDVDPGVEPPPVDTTPTITQIAESIVSTPGFYMNEGVDFAHLVLNGHEWNYWWVRSSLYNGVDFAPGIPYSQQFTSDEALKVFQRMLSPSMAGLGRLASVWAT